VSAGPHRATPFRHGEILAARYEVLENVHVSERTVVARARDRRDGGLVALKCRRTNGEAERRVLSSEASILLRVPAHRGIPILRDDGLRGADACAVIVLDWIDGVDGARALAERTGHRFSVPDGIRIVTNLAEILDHLHAQDPVVIHGDVKPSNIMLRPDGSVVLIDFDVAGTGNFRAAAGSQGFTAPEVAAAGPVSQAVDVYSMAATAVALLTGAAPANGAFELAGDGGSSLSRALHQGLALEPSRRPRSAGELAARLLAST
jgi:serine/threonine-protein kinase